MGQPRRGIPQATDRTRAAALLLALAMALDASPHAALAEEASARACESPAAKLVSVQGTVEWRRAGETAWQAATPDQPFCPGDAIRVLPRSRADLLEGNQTALRLNGNTTLTIEGTNQNGTAAVVCCGEPPTS
jgi:hypothetical protein